MIFHINFEYAILVDAYKRTADSVSKGYSIRVRIVNNSGLTVCPYCNRDYINYREKMFPAHNWIIFSVNLIIPYLLFVYTISFRYVETAIG